MYHRLDTTTVLCRSLRVNINWIENIIIVLLSVFQVSPYPDLPALQNPEDPAVTPVLAQHHQPALISNVLKQIRTTFYFLLCTKWHKLFSKLSCSIFSPEYPNLTLESLFLVQAYFVAQIRRVCNVCPPGGSESQMPPRASLEEVHTQSLQILPWSAVTGRQGRKWVENK